jgi:hypothetical protein
LDKALAARNAARDEVDEISRREAALAETLSGIDPG